MSVHDPSTLGGRIRQLRIAAQLSQRDFANRVAQRLQASEHEHRGFDFTYLSKIETGRLVPSAAVVIAIADLLGANQDDLLALAGKAPQDVSNLLKESPGARMFFRSALSRDLSEEDWRKLIEQIETDKEDPPA